MSQILSDASVTEQVDPRHWRVLLGGLHTVVATGTFSRGAELATQIAALADRLDHHPDLDVRYGAVHITTVSHDVGGLTARDVRLAGLITALLDASGLDARPAAPQQLEVGIDALDIPAIVPFWRAVLGYRDERPGPGGSSPALVDPAGRGPAVWFQQMDAPRPQRNRIHLDVTVPHDVAIDRVAAAVAAGGVLVSDAAAPAFWVLADAEGNEACVCTWQGRD